MNVELLRLLTPEIMLIATAVGIYTAGAFFSVRRLWQWLALAVMLAAACMLACQSLGDNADFRIHETGSVAFARLNFDGMAYFGRWLALAIGGLLMLMNTEGRVAGPLASQESTVSNVEQHGRQAIPLNSASWEPYSPAPELPASLLLAVAGTMLVFGANELVLMFLGLELISIPTYLLLYLGHRDVQSREAAAKYFFLSVLSSAVLLYGLSFLYGLGGSTVLSTVRTSIVADALPAGFPLLVRLAWGLIFAGLCFRIAAVPLHFYAPDVYQGTTNPNAALLSTLPKAAGLAAMVRVLAYALPSQEPWSWQIVAVVSVLTMTLGNTLALWQDNFRRLLAYSSIAQAGYMLIGLAACIADPLAPGAWNGLAAMWFYLAVYAAATVGAFAVLDHLGLGKRGQSPFVRSTLRAVPANGDCPLFPSVDSLDELAGLGRTRPAAAAMLTVCLLSLTGLPPLAGFWGKLLLFGGALNVDSGHVAARWWFIGLAIAGVINAVVAAAYYLRITAVMYFRTPLDSPIANGGTGPRLAAVCCTLALLAAGVYPGPLMRGACDANHAAVVVSNKTATPVCPITRSGDIRPSRITAH